MRKTTFLRTPSSPGSQSLTSQSVQQETIKRGSNWSMQLDRTASKVLATNFGADSHREKLVVRQQQRTKDQQPQSILKKENLRCPSPRNNIKVISRLSDTKDNNQLQVKRSSSQVQRCDSSLTQDFSMALSESINMFDRTQQNSARNSMQSNPISLVKMARTHGEPV